MMRRGVISVSGVVVKRAEVLEDGTIAELVLVLRLNHARSLCAQGADDREQINHPLRLQAFQHMTECDEDSCPSNTGTVHCIES